MKIQEAKEIDIVDYLQKIGISPSRISGNSYWYLSPLHEERTASFKVNRQINRMYDSADGIGCNLVDFGTRYHQYDVSSFLQKLNDIPDHINQVQRILPADITPGDESNHIKITAVQQIKSYSLLHYLNTRRIVQPIACAHLKEVHYQLDEKNYYALGFKNDAGGYELRNQYIKASSSPKDITFIDNGAKDIAVFEAIYIV